MDWGGTTNESSCHKRTKRKRRKSHPTQSASLSFSGNLVSKAMVGYARNGKEGEGGGGKKGRGGIT